MNYIKNIFTIITAVLIGAGGTVANASTFTFAPNPISVKRGETFAVAVTLDSQGKSIYTGKLGLNFPANLVRLESFVFATGWFPLAQPGYDLTDNANGVLIKTAGFPGGASNITLLGTASFTAIASGSGNVTANAESLALDSTNQNTLVGTPSVALSVSAPAPAPASSPVPAPAPTLKSEPRPESKPLPSIEELATSTEASEEPEAATSSPLTANIADFFTDVKNLLRLAFAAGVAALVGFILTLLFWRKKKE